MAMRVCELSRVPVLHRLGYSDTYLTNDEVNLLLTQEENLF